MELKEKKSLQFELWQECNSKCIMCYLGENNICTPDCLKLKAINDAYNFINDPEKIKDYNVLSYIGGEFFQGQLSNLEVKKAFLKLIKKTAELQISGQIKEFWLMCTLTIGNQNDLYDSLDVLKDIYNKAGKPELIEQVWIVTSYDTIGRFHTQKMKDNWSYHMNKIYSEYPGIKFNTCMILTQDLITKYLNNEFSFHDYQNIYHSGLFFKQPAPGATKIDNPNILVTSIEGRRLAKQIMEKKLPRFFPKRETFLKFLIKFRKDCPELYDHLFNVVYRADDLYRNMNDEEDGHRMQYNHRDKQTKNEITEGDLNQHLMNSCGHLLDYCAYIDSDNCMICDRDMIKGLS